jgi:hypothetical protein
VTDEIHRNLGTEKYPRSGVWTPVSRHWLWAIIVLGVGLRLAQYATDRSLWCDEALLALNVLHRPTVELFEPLDYHQGAPVGFLLLEKLATKLAGHGELALRAFPLAFGIVGLVVFWRVASLYVSPRAAPVAVSLFAFSGSLVYYSSETKQYSGDVAVCVVLLWLVWRLSVRSVSTAELLGLSLGGSAAVWFSHPASFLLSGAGLALMCFAFVEHDWLYFRRLSYACGLWGLSFLACYVVSLHTLTRDQVLLDFWRNYFPPLPLWSWSNLSFLIERFFTTFSDPAGLVSIVGAAIFVVGCIRLARRNIVYFSLLAVPVLTTLLGAFLHKYPLGGRFLLFLLPILFLFIGEGAIVIAEASGQLYHITRLAVLVILLMKPISADLQTLINPSRPEDIKLAILHIQTHERPGDVWYVYHWARYQFWYYSEVYRVQPTRVWIGVDCGTDVACYSADLDKLRGQPRVWVLFSHIWTGDGLQEEALFLDHLDRLGVRLDSYRSTGARAYLYDLSQSASAANSTSR